jgi:hypothetical protein
MRDRIDAEKAATGKEDQNAGSTCTIAGGRASRLVHWGSK